MRRLILLLAVLTGLLAGCGASGPSVNGHSCADSYAMQCALTPPPKAVTPPFLGRAAPVTYGVDFAWGGPRSCASMRAIGATFGASYFSFDSTGKNWNLSLVNAFHACGIATVGVWETSANRATQGFNAGYNDAFTAIHQASSLGWPIGSVIDYAVDCDCAGADIAGYFQGVQSYSRKAGYEDDAYGGYFQVSYLHSHGLVGNHNWQTYAWSSQNGVALWLPASIAPLEQYLNGLTYDHDRAIAGDYGQIPRPGPVKPPGPTKAQIKFWTGARDSSLRAYHSRHCSRPVLGPKNCRVFADRVVHWESKLPTHPHCWGKHRQLGAAVCQIVRPTVSLRNHAASATYNVYRAKGCFGPNGQTPQGGPVCGPLLRRAKWFESHAHSVYKTWA